MLIFKVLHVLSMFTAVTLLEGVPTFMALAIWQRDVRGAAAVFRLARRPGNTMIGGVFLLAGIVFGLLTAATGGLDFFAGWLIAAYVLVAALILSNLLPANADSDRSPRRRSRPRPASARSTRSSAHGDRSALIRGA
jgi:hypothetical protein